MDVSHSHDATREGVEVSVIFRTVIKSISNWRPVNEIRTLRVIKERSENQVGTPDLLVQVRGVRKLLNDPADNNDHREPQHWYNLIGTVSHRVRTVVRESDGRISN